MRKLKEKFNQGCRRLWIAGQNARGTVVTENLLITVAIVIAVFALAALVFMFLKNYSTGIFGDITEKGGIGSDFGGGVTFD
jgi:hypothetical protein